ncbi:MAG: sigma-70 family RNA polymerase sigma factor [Phycisphaeraceae bacterium]|nr:MAG: sigma-70 family RNA polymerase sigma factor [Phycisphaeraceae bacterium]
MTESRSGAAPKTSATLVGRLRDPADAEAWQLFHERYRGLIVGFLRRRGLQVADAEDLAQMVTAKLVSGLRGFEYDPERGGFRAYLYRCTRSVLSDHFRRQASRTGAVSMDEDRNGAGAEPDDAVFAAFEREWVNHHYRLAVSRYREKAEESSLAVLDATIAGHPPKVIAETLSMSESAVYKAQQRLRDRLRDLIAGQLADEEIEHHRVPG